MAGVSVQFDRANDFSRYRTFAWKDGTAARRPAIQAGILSAVQRELEAAGMRKIDEAPDVYVLTHALVDEHTLEDLSDATYWKFWTGIGRIDLEAIKVGTLVVDLLDPATGKIVWRGLATGAVDAKVKKITRKIDRLVGKLFRDFPPPDR